MIRETTPARITQVIIDFCASITSDSLPEYIDVCPAPWAALNECFNNVYRMVKQYGGSMISGWAVWQRGNMLLDAEAHAIWRAPDGKLIDITPHSYNEKRILFLFDSSVCYQGITIPSHRQALTDSPLVAEFIRLYSERDHFMQSSTLGNVYVMPADLHNRINALQFLFSHEVGRNDPCPCGSGLKYKKCCGQFQ